MVNKDGILKFKTEGFVCNETRFSIRLKPFAVSSPCDQAVSRWSCKLKGDQ